MTGIGRLVGRRFEAERDATEPALFRMFLHIQAQSTFFCV